MHGQLLATFDNGRLEGYLELRTLTPVALTEPAMAGRIARRLKQFHRSKVSLPGVDPGASELFATMWKSCGGCSLHPSRAPIMANRCKVCSAA